MGACNCMRNLATYKGIQESCAIPRHNIDYSHEIQVADNSCFLYLLKCNLYMYCVNVLVHFSHYFICSLAGVAAAISGE